MKASIHTHLNYLVIVSPPFQPSGSAPSATVRNFARTADTTNIDVTKITVLDLENKFVAYSNTFTDGVREVFSSFGEIYFLSNTGKVRSYICIAISISHRCYWS